MRTRRRTRLVLPGGRPRIYEVELVEQDISKDARFLVNFRYGWEGGTLEEGTRTPDPLSESEAARIFDSVVVARQNQGYRTAGDAPPAAKQPELKVVRPDADPREQILARRLRGIDALEDKKAAGLLRRVGELRLHSQIDAVARIAEDLIADGKRIIALRALPYVLHRIDDGSGRAAALLERLSLSPDAPTAETALILRTVRDSAVVPAWSLYPAVLQSAVGLPAPEVREAAAQAYFQSAIATYDPRTRTDTTDAEKSLRMLYAHGAHDPTARALSLAVLRTAPLSPPLFRAVRRILQAAEAIDDAEVFALIGARLDDKRPAGAVVLVEPGNPRRGYRSVYGRRTRQYLRKRMWRTLRRLGDSADRAYAPMAAAVLLTLDDQPKPTELAETRPDAGAALLPACADRYAANKIMFAAGSRIAPSEATLRWRYTRGVQPEATSREEPFGALWTDQPEQLWRVIVGGRALAPVAFAARAVKEAPSFLDSMPTSDIAGLLGTWHPYAPRLDLAISLAERRIARDGLKEDLAAALMAEPTRGGALVKLMLAARPEFLANEPALFAIMLARAAKDNLVWFSPLALKAGAAATTATRADVLLRALADVQSATWPAEEMARARALSEVLIQVFGAEIASIDAGVLQALSRQTSEPKLLIAARLAVARPDGATIVDVGALARSTTPELRAAGIALIAQRSLDALVADLESVAAFLTTDDAQPRAAARPIAARLQLERPEAARRLAEMLLPALYRTEQHEGLRDDVLAVMSNELLPSVAALGPDTIWTLLRARAETARRLGAEVIGAFKPANFSVRQLARIGCSDQAKARRWAFAALDARAADVRAKPEDAFALLDASTEDAREAGYALYRTHMQPEDWTPPALVALANSTTEPAQRFGREMIGKVFEAKNADFLLSRLAEHPAPGFRLLVARLMRDYVQDDTQRLNKLVATIETTLLQVRKGRAAKHQVMSFIEEQLGHPGEERVAVLAPVLERCVATCAIEDRAHLLSLLTAIKRKSPQLAPRIKLVPREAR